MNSRRQLRLSSTANSMEVLLYYKGGNIRIHVLILRFNLPMKWYISFDILAAANGIVKEHLPPFFVNQGPLNIDRFYLESM